MWQRWHSQTCKISAQFSLKHPQSKPITSICLPPFLLLTLLTKPKAFQDVFSNNWFFFLRKIRPQLISQGRTGCTHPQLFLQKTWAEILSKCSSGASLPLLSMHFTKLQKEGQKWGNGGGGLNNCYNPSCRNAAPSPTIPGWRELTMFVSSFHALTNSCETCLKTKWINPGAVNKTCDPSFGVSMLLLDIFSFYRTTSPTSQLRNQETNCFKTAKNSRVTIPDFTMLVGINPQWIWLQKAPCALSSFFSSLK